MTLRVGWGLVVVLGVCCTTAGMSADEAGLRPSIEAGVTLSTWRTSGPDPNPFRPPGSDRYGTLTGFYAGASVAMPRGPVAVRAGLTFSRRGTEIPADPETIRVDYVDLPVLLELRPWRREGVRPLLLAGVAVSRRLHVSSSQFPEADLDESVKATDAAMIGGAGVEAGRVAFEAKYNWGLLDIRSGGQSPRTRNRSWSLGARLRL